VLFTDKKKRKKRKVFDVVVTSRRSRIFSSKLKENKRWRINVSTTQV